MLKHVPVARFFAARVCACIGGRGSTLTEKCADGRHTLLLGRKYVTHSSQFERYTAQRSNNKWTTVRFVREQSPTELTTNYYDAKYG